jgi:branched-chain amino acid transport system substrate-binding protein
VRVPVVARYQAALPSGAIPSYAGLQVCLDVLVLADVLRRKSVQPTKTAVLRALKQGGVVQLGGFEVDLSDRSHPGSRFVDIVMIDGAGRIAR